MDLVSEKMVRQDRQSHSGVTLEQADACTVIAVWTLIMSTLLRYDWQNKPLETVEDIWCAYCTMQNVLMNLFDEEALTQALEYARRNKILSPFTQF